MIPNVARRYLLPLKLDHYTSQMLTGHGDFQAQLYSFRLVNSPNCSCSIGGAETVAHVLLKFRRTQAHREALKATLYEEGVGWSPEDLNLTRNLGPVAGAEDRIQLQYSLLVVKGD
ncbi:Reverse transcriptase domain-containing protein [Aphis craccivora]|uniref:Reverse transcriptase domain-containing protein n=1 Tax=Aphis craccivora TaxID=307492 RepID=A0A6G0Y8J5_APHCR|nr:Reverse transcriptase domain-containing protein [Aphis craccivora]